MLKWALIFFVISVIAGFFGFCFHLVIALPLHLFAGIDLPWWWFGVPGVAVALWFLPKVIGKLAQPGGLQSFFVSTS